MNTSGMWFFSGVQFRDSSLNMKVGSSIAFSCQSTGIKWNGFEIEEHIVLYFLWKKTYPYNTLYKLTLDMVIKFSGCSKINRCFTSSTLLAEQNQMEGKWISSFSFHWTVGKHFVATLLKDLIHSLKRWSLFLRMHTVPNLTDYKTISFGYQLNSAWAFDRMCHQPHWFPV